MNIKITQTQKEELFKRAQKELTEYQEAMLKLSPKEILTHAGTYWFYNEMAANFSNDSVSIFSDAVLYNLVSCNHPLQYLYCHWLEAEISPLFDFVQLLNNIGIEEGE